MDKPLLLPLLLLLGAFSFMFLPGVVPDTTCMVCQRFKEGHCLRGKGNCTMEQGPGCRTKDIFLFSDRVGWFFSHSEMDCFDYCLPTNFFYQELKISTYCCKGQEFCNRYKGRSSQWKPK